jgi:hypothetical protein
VALGAILLSCLIYFPMRKNNPGLVAHGVIISLFAWFVIPLAYFRIRTVMREGRNSNEIIREQNDKYAEYQNSQRIGSVRVAEKMGFSTYTWIPVYNLLSVETSKGKRQNFIWQQNVLNVYCEILQPPLAADTVGWLKLVLNEAATFIHKDYKYFELCINSHDYHFSRSNISNLIHISICNSDDKSIRLSAIFKTETREEYYGNLSFQLPFDTTAKWSSSN